MSEEQNDWDLYLDSIAFLTGFLGKIQQRHHPSTFSILIATESWAGLGNEATRFYGNVPTQYAASILYSKRSIDSKVSLGVLPTVMDFASTKSLTKDM